MGKPAKLTIAALSVAVVVLSVLLVTSGCCAVPRPAKVGVPESVERSEDFVLPLKDGPTKDGKTTLERLQNYLADPTGEADDVTAPDVGIYRELLKRLNDNAPVLDDLKDQGALMDLSVDAGWVVAIHDARYDGPDLTAANARGLVKGDYVFAFFKQRLTLKDGVWVVGRVDGDKFTGLVVFSKTYLEVPPAK